MKHNWYLNTFMVIVISLLVFLLSSAGLNKSVRSNSLNSISNFSQKAENLRPEVVPGVVVVKIKSAPVAHALVKASAVTGLSSLDVRLQQFGVTSVQKMFHHKPIHAKSGISDISRILKVSIPVPLNPVVVAQELECDPNVEYAEPVYLRKICAAPNDPMYSQQHHLPQIQAPEGWDVQQGDSTVIIGIVDTGFDYLHEDLAANVWTNELEANGVTGVDDDGNGFVDDIHGWDFGNNDPDPIFPPTGDVYAAHGTICAGLACAVTNNGIGIAGVNWNCRYMPIKGFDDDGNGWSINLFDGIVYAVDNGADVVSNSWGGLNFLQWEQDVINYAHSKGAIIVCAAGNYDVDWCFYPASYQHAVSVAAVNRSDQKASYSSFGPWVDICAPGGDWDAGLLTTIPGNKYASQNMQGTSLSTPVAAGICGLVKAQHPEWTNDQIVRQVLLTADNIDGSNPQYTNRLGHGRVNAFKALTVSPNDLPEPDARLAILSFQLNDSLYGNSNGIFERGETIQLNLEIKNWSIGATNAATIQLSCANTDVQIPDGTVGSMFFPADTTLPFAYNFKIADQAVAQVAELVLTMTTDRGYRRVESTQISIGKMAVLLVDNDNSDLTAYFPDVESFYQNILHQKNLLYGYMNALNPGLPKVTFPKATTLSEFPIVVVMASSPSPIPNFIQFTLGMEARDALREYLDGGGHLFICGQDIGAHTFEAVGTEESEAFMRDYLHAEYIVNDNQDHNVSGMTDDPISQNLSFHIWQPLLYEGWQWPDVIAPTAGASTIFTYKGGRTAAIKYAGDHKVVYFSFGGLEAVDSDENTQIGNLSPIRTELFMRILNWLNFIEHEPLTMTEDITNPRTINAKISSNVTDLQAVTLFWRLQGQQNFTSIPMTETAARHYAADIPGPGTTVTIEYYLHTSHTYYDWQSPVGAPDTLYSYYIGPDTVKPVITEVSKVRNHLSNWEPCPVSAMVKDNLGIDTNRVYVYFQARNRVIVDSVLLTATGEPDHFASELPLKFSVGDTVEYRVEAKDVSAAGNISLSTWENFVLGYEDFENGLESWQVDSAGWGSYRFGHTGRYSANCAPQGYYRNNLDISLTSKFGVDLSQTNKAVLAFWTAYNIEENKDFGFIEISTDSAATWQRLDEVFTGIQISWRADSVSLTRLGAGFNDVRVRFRFISDSTQAHVLPGWYIDDLRIIPDVEVQSVIAVNELALPRQFMLLQNYPNPFNPTTMINYQLPMTCEVDLSVYNILGQKVATLVAERQQAGSYKVEWDASKIASGVYLYRIEAGNFTDVRKMIIMK